MKSGPGSDPVPESTIRTRSGGLVGRICTFYTATTAGSRKSNNSCGPVCRDFATVRAAPIFSAFGPEFATTSHQQGGWFGINGHRTFAAGRHSEAVRASRTDTAQRPERNSIGNSAQARWQRPNLPCRDIRPGPCSAVVCEPIAAATGPAARARVSSRPSSCCLRWPRCRSLSTRCGRRSCRQAALFHPPSACPWPCGPSRMHGEFFTAGHTPDFLRRRCVSF